MIETQVRALFADIAAEPAPARVDTELAHRRGRARLRWRRAGQAGVPVLAAATVAAVVLGIGAIPFRSGPGPAAQPAPPRQFNPLVPYVSFGWLPAGERFQYGNTTRPMDRLAAGPSPARTPWLLQALPGGACHLNGPARQLTCRLARLGDMVLRVDGRAPAVHGRAAYWAHANGAPAAQGYLAWPYARGGWALLIWHDPQSPGFPWRPQAVRIAANARFGAHAAPPLAFPARLTGVPASWQVSAVMYRPFGAVLLASQYMVTSGPASLVPGGGTPFGTPVIDVQPASARGSCSFIHGRSARKVLGGYQAIVTHFGAAPLSQLLCARHADGLWVEISVYGKPSALGVAALFAHHMRLLGPDPDHWTRNPTG